jgi:phospho-N-acetylmuramoyl-pentapeptide-transferase
MAFLASVISTFLLIFALTKFKLHQVEREEGPVSHQSKSGTLTMGGLVFVLVSALFAYLMVDMRYFPVILLFLGFSLIGFVDDLVKILKARNLGLTFWQKIILQTLFAGAFIYYLIFFTDHWISSGIFIPLGIIFYFLFSIFLIVGCANAANLTDGLDGLLSGISILAFSAFLAIALKIGFIGAAAYCVIFIGSILGFMVYNFPKAKIFMGDTGSLGLGAAFAGLAFLMHKELALAIICGVFLIEALSVIIQVTSYKLFKKRIFKMAPLHHHFEMMGMSELKVVVLFWSVQLILSLIGALTL